jgi:elongation factor Ts
MSEISFDVIRQLRQLTSCGIGDCKKALEASEGDFEKAVDWLRQKGLAKSVSKDRVTAEGVVGVVADDHWGAVLKVSSETDFVARNEQFQGFVRSLLDIIRKDRISTLDDLRVAKLPSGESVEDAFNGLVAAIGESLKLTSLDVVEEREGRVFSYIHGSLGKNLGKMGVLIALRMSGSGAELDQLGEHLTMHIAASNPLSVTRSDLAQELIEREKAIVQEQVKASGKPEAAVEKITEGRMNKFYSDCVLEEQSFFIDGKKTVKTVIEEHAKTAGHPISVARFERVIVG